MAFDERKAQRVVRFIEALKHTKGEFHGKPFELLPWQERIIRDVFGTVRDDDPTQRQYTSAYIEIPKKNGKSELGAAIALNMLVNDDEWKAEVYSCASDRQQAAIVFDVAVDIFQLLDIAEASRDAAIAVGVVAVEGYGNRTVAAGIHFTLIEDRLYAIVDNLGSLTAVSVEEVAVRIGFMDDARRVRAKIQSLLSSGLTETERSDLEEADKVIANFLENVEALSSDVNAEQLEKQYQELLTAFDGGSIDFRQALHSFYIKRYNEITLREKNWCERWLVIDPEAMTQTELDAWKASTLVVPTYVSAENRAVLINLREAVEKALSKQRIDYILMLFSKLTEGEKVNCLAQLSNNE